MFTKVFLALSISSISATAFSQGAAVVSPISKAEFNTKKSITFYVSNRLKKTLSIKYTPVCDIDGKEITGKVCNDYFSVFMSIEPENDEIDIPVGKRLKVEVKIKKNADLYSLYKPIIDPVLEEVKKKKKGINFVFNYQPGYIFLFKIDKTQLATPKFSTYKNNQIKGAKFSFDLSSLKSPQVVSMSAKIMNSKTKKMLRFLRLANQKILDPKRKVFNLEGPYGDPNNKEDVCYQIFIQNHSQSTDIYNLTNCDESQKKKAH